MLLRSPLRILALLALLVLGPNLLWASRSSVMLHNVSQRPMVVRLVLTDEPPQVIDAGTLEPGARRFMWITPSGEASLSVEVEDEHGLGWRRHCNDYVEDGMYRVEATIASPDEVTCEVSLPIFERLLVRDVLE